MNEIKIEIVAMKKKVVANSTTVANIVTNFTSGLFVETQRKKLEGENEVLTKLIIRYEKALIDTVTYDDVMKERNEKRLADEAERAEARRDYEATSTRKLAKVEKKLAQEKERKSRAEQGRKQRQFHFSRPTTSFDDKIQREIDNYFSVTLPPDEVSWLRTLPNNIGILFRRSIFFGAREPVKLANDARMEVYTRYNMRNSREPRTVQVYTPKAIHTYKEFGRNNGRKLLRTMERAKILA